MCPAANQYVSFTRRLLQKPSRTVCPRPTICHRGCVSRARLYLAFDRRKSGGRIGIDALRELVLWSRSRLAASESLPEQGGSSCLKPPFPPAPTTQPTATESDRQIEPQRAAEGTLATPAGNADSAVARSTDDHAAASTPQSQVDGHPLCLQTRPVNSGRSRKFRTTLKSIWMP